MPTNDEFFTPEEVDEQIEFLSRAQGSDASGQAARTVSHLRQFYKKSAQKHIDPLERAWERIVEEHQRANQASQRKGRLISMQGFQAERQDLQILDRQRVLHKRRRAVRSFGILAAVLLIAVLVGGGFLLNAARGGMHSTPDPTSVAQIGSGGAPQPKPPHPITGGKCSIDTTRTSPQKSKTSVPGLYIFGVYEPSSNLLYRYDPQTKKVIWSKKFCSHFESNGTIEQNGVLYLMGVDVTHESGSGMVSYLYALNETDGSAIWGVQFPTKVIPFPKNLGEASPIDLGAIGMPTIANGILYVVQNSGIVYAFDAATGDQLWTFDSGRNAWVGSQGGSAIAGPTDIQVVNGVAYFAIVDRLFALDAKTGKELWLHNFGNALNIDTNPAIANGTLYAAAYAPQYGSGVSSETSIYAFDARTGAQKWVSAKIPRSLVGPMAYNGKVYEMSAHTWYTLNPTSGAIEAQKTLANNTLGFLSLINGVLYFLTEGNAHNTLFVLNPDGSTKWSVSVEGEYPIIDDVRDGVVYLSGRGSGVYAYSASDGKFLWHYGGYLMQPDAQSLVTIVP